MKRIGLVLMVFAFLAYCPSTGQSQEVGDNAPDFSFVDASGKEIKLSDFKGMKNVVEKYQLRYDSFMAAYATIIISKEGRIRFKSVEDRATRTSASTIIKELQGIQ